MKIKITEGNFNLKIRHRVKKFIGFIKPRDMIIEVDKKTAGLIYDEYWRKYMQTRRYLD